MKEDRWAMTYCGFYLFWSLSTGENLLLDHTWLQGRLGSVVYMGGDKPSCYRRKVRMSFGQLATSAKTMCLLAQCLVHCKHLTNLSHSHYRNLGLPSFFCASFFGNQYNKKMVSKIIKAFWELERLPALFGMGKIKGYFWSAKTIQVGQRGARKWKYYSSFSFHPLCGLLGKYYFPYGGLSYSWHVWERSRGWWGKHFSSKPEQALQVSGILSIPHNLAPASVDFCPSGRREVLTGRPKAVWEKTPKSQTRALACHFCKNRLSAGLLIIAVHTVNSRSVQPRWVVG